MIVSGIRLRLVVTGWLISLVEIVVLLAELRLVPFGPADVFARAVRRRHESDLDYLKRSIS